MALVIKQSSILLVLAFVTFLGGLFGYFLNEVKGDITKLQNGKLEKEQYVTLEAIVKQNTENTHRLITLTSVQQEQIVMLKELMNNIRKE